MKKSNLIALLVVSAAVGATALFGGFFTGPNVAPMFQDVRKPAWAPPGWLFGPVWTLLYILMIVAGRQVWVAMSSQNVRTPLTLFFVQLVFNGLWTLIYFELRMPWLAFFEIMVLLGLILACIRTFWSVSRAASLCMAPYALWVGFAAALNFSIAIMNP